MSGKGFLREFLYAAACAAVLGAQTSNPATGREAREQGWKLFQQARQAFRGGNQSPIHDYSFDLTTQVHTPQGVTQLASKTFFVFPGFIRQEINTPQGKTVVVFDGDHGWQQGAAGRRELSSEAAAQIRAELARNNVLLAPEPDETLVRYMGSEDVGGRPAEIVQISDVGGTLLRLYLDSETHDVLKQAFVGDTPRGLAQVEEIFSEFHEVGGYRWYHHRKLIRNGEVALESTRSNLQVNVGYEPAGLLEEKAQL
jgi:hypothetical protein